MVNRAYPKKWDQLLLGLDAPNDIWDENKVSNKNPTLTGRVYFFGFFNPVIPALL